MTKRTRTILFIICLFLFLLAAPGVVLYSQGYRFDFEQKRLTQTGAFFTKVLPRATEVYLNGERKGRTSFFNNSLWVENLLPKKYEIEIKKKGYHSWQKTLQISERQVTEAKHVILFPQSPEVEVAAADETEITAILADIEIEKEAKAKTPLLPAGLEYNNFSVSPDEKKIAYSTDHEIWVFFLETQYDIEKEPGDNIFLTRFSEKIDEISWLNNHYLIFNAGDKIKVTEIDNRDRLNIVELTELKNPKLYWDKNNKIIYILSEERLFWLQGLLP